MRPSGVRLVVAVGKSPIAAAWPNRLVSPPRRPNLRPLASALRPGLLTQVNNLQEPAAGGDRVVSVLLVHPSNPAGKGLGGRLGGNRTACSTYTLMLVKQRGTDAPTRYSSSSNP